jgi:hypothetical protein
MSATLCAAACGTCCIPGRTGPPGPQGQTRNGVGQVLEESALLPGSEGFEDLFGTPPAVTYTFLPGEMAMVTLGCKMAFTDNIGFMGFRAEGPPGFTTINPSPDESLTSACTPVSLTDLSRSFLVTLTVPGSYTFTAQFASSGDVTFSNPTIFVQPLKFVPEPLLV